MSNREIVGKKTLYGIIEGFVSDSGIHTYLGIPYAKPPIGKYRWKAPRKLDKSNDIISAKEFGLSAMQHYDPWELASSRPMGEDCLTLNIWHRNNGKSNKPVMVYVHGGGYFSGGSADPLYHGENIVKNHDVIVVSINYRINIYGFLNLGAIDSEYSQAGYCGILDQIAALEWIQENIEFFGGDKNNVTVFGESCGSGSVMLLSVTPKAKGLFHKVIAESGPIQLYNTPKQSEKYARDFMAMCGCATVAEMVKMTTEELSSVYDLFREKYYYEIELLFAPTCDGTLIPEKPFRALKDGAARDIKLMNGTTLGEYNYWSLYYDDMEKEMPIFHQTMMPIHYDQKLSDDLFKKCLNEYKDHHPEKNVGECYMDFMTQLDFRVPHELMSIYQSGYNDVYFYVFKYVSKIPKLGNCHAIELPFVTGNLDSESGLNFTGENPPKELSVQMMAAWVNFATTGDPNGASVPALWEPYSYKSQKTMIIDEGDWHMEEDFNRETVEMLDIITERTLL